MLAPLTCQLKAVSIYGQPKALAENQKFEPSCPWDNHHFYFNADTANDLHDWCV